MVAEKSDRSTVSSFLSIQQTPVNSEFACDHPACMNPPNPKYREIGAGTCGRIFHSSDPELNHMILKVEKVHSYGVQRGLENDWIIQKRTCENFRLLRKDIRDLRDVHIPEGIRYFQNRLNLELPPSGRELGARDTLQMEYIPPVPAQLRHAFLLRLQNSELSHMGDRPHHESTNRDCLIRLYLGKEHDQRIMPRRTFTLRNYSLCIADFEHLGLLSDNNENSTSTAAVLCRKMGAALAALHFSVNCDARDVEFVLGGRPINAEKDGYEYNIPNRDVHLWLLDFNQVGALEWDIDGGTKAIEQIVFAFQSNDPYFPRPGRGPPDLWLAFSETYRLVALRILYGQSEERQALPSKVLIALEAAQVEKNRIAAVAETRTPGAFEAAIV